MNKTKHIRSFVIRQRRLAPNKQKIFDEAWKIYGLNSTSGKISLEKTFGRNAPLVLEIGFGMGLTLFNSAKKYPEHDFIGIEVHQPGIVALLAQLKTQALNNIRIINADAVMVLEQCIPDNSLEQVLIFFPDPWPKNRHHKRRLIQPEFIALLQKKLKSKGILHIATDWEDYANHILAVLKNNPAFMALEPHESSRFLTDRISTKFEQRGKKQGHKIFDLLFINSV
jgi:tRNA (guanine-N7-)-methyltransferase